MNRALSLCALMFVAACQTSTTPVNGLPAGFAPADPPLPPEVEASIPADLGIANVVVRDGCYYTFVDGRIEPVVTEAMRAGGFTDQPFCVG